MGLPRYLSNRYKTEIQVQSPEMMPFQMVLCCLTLSNARILQIFNAALHKNGSVEAFVSALHRGYFAYQQLRQFSQDIPDYLDRVQSSMYVGLTAHQNGTFKPDFRQVLVPRYIVSKLKEFNIAREDKDRHEVKLAQLIMAHKLKVYASRAFPSSLRAIIFDRDKHTCRRCLRDRERLRRQALHLEVDHIVAVVDGGLTTYANGETLCSDCNKAKHHAKHYLQAAMTLYSK